MRALLALLATVALTACAGGEQVTARGPDDLDPMEPFGTAEIALVAEDGQRTRMSVYVADDPAARRQGLMGVSHLPPEAGMVFLFPDDNDGGFWMKNTLIPLSIAFFDADGQVLAVLDMEPCTDEPCPSYDPGVSYRGALEVNRGRFDELGLGEDGWRVALES